MQPFEKKYQTFLAKHTKLLEETSENFILESMNWMKAENKRMSDSMHVLHSNNHILTKRLTQAMARENAIRVLLDSYRPEQYIEPIKKLLN